MTLEFNGTRYTTIQDIKDRFHVAEKTIKKLIKRGAVPEPETVVIGTRRFRHFSNEWIQLFKTALATRHAQNEDEC